MLLTDHNSPTSQYVTVMPFCERHKLKQYKEANYRKTSSSRPTCDATLGSCYAWICICIFCQLIILQRRTVVDFCDVCLCFQQVYDDGQQLNGSVVEFEQAGKELLAVVVDEDRPDLHSRLASLVARWKVCQVTLLNSLSIVTQYMLPCCRSSYVSYVWYVKQNRRSKYNIKRAQ